MHLAKCIDASTCNTIEWEMERGGGKARGRIAKRNNAYAEGERGREMRGKEERCGDLCIRVRREVDAAIIIYRCKILSHRRRQWRGKPAVNRARSRERASRYRVSIAPDSIWIYSLPIRRVTSSTYVCRARDTRTYWNTFDASPRVKYPLSRRLNRAWNYGVPLYRSVIFVQST